MCNSSDSPTKNSRGADKSGDLGSHLKSPNCEIRWCGNMMLYQPVVHLNCRLCVPNRTPVYAVCTYGLHPLHCCILRNIKTSVLSAGSCILNRSKNLWWLLCSFQCGLICIYLLFPPSRSIAGCVCTPSIRYLKKCSLQTLNFCTHNVDSMDIIITDIQILVLQATDSYCDWANWKIFLLECSDGDEVGWCSTTYGSICWNSESQYSVTVAPFRPSAPNQTAFCCSAFS